MLITFPLVTGSEERRFGISSKLHVFLEDFLIIEFSSISVEPLNES